MLEEMRFGDNGTYIYDKVAVAIDRLRFFEALALEYDTDGYYLCDSGGKDSSVIKHLAIMAGVMHGVHHNHTTIDHPETVYFIRREKSRYQEMGISYTVHYPKMSFWRLMRKKKMPPTRVARYCCSELKEHGGDGKVCITGVRWAESVRRKLNRGIAEIQVGKISETINLLNDNADARKEFETCQAKGKHIVNPIVDWTDEDVWEFIERYKITVNPLYTMGYSRVGCVGCPMSSRHGAELDAMPKYRQAFMRTLSRIIQETESAGRESRFKKAQDWYDWWIGNLPNPIDDEQIKMEFDEEKLI